LNRQAGVRLVTSNDPFSCKESPIPVSLVTAPTDGDAADDQHSKATKNKHASRDLTMVYIKQMARPDGCPIVALSRHRRGASGCPLWGFFRTYPNVLNSTEDAHLKSVSTLRCR